MDRREQEGALKHIRNLPTVQWCCVRCAGVIEEFWTLLLEIRNWQERKWGHSIYSNTFLQWSFMWLNFRPCLRTLSSLGTSHPFGSFQIQTIQSIVFRPWPCSSHFQEIILREDWPASWLGQPHWSCSTATLYQLYMLQTYSALSKPVLPWAHPRAPGPESH